jgi:hypothetical protein
MASFCKDLPENFSGENREGLINSPDNEEDKCTALQLRTQNYHSVLGSTQLK